VSTRVVGRSVHDCVSDLLALVDHLGWLRFAVTGGSGGGPHALTCGVLLKARSSSTQPSTAVPQGLAPRRSKFAHDGLVGHGGDVGLGELVAVDHHPGEAIRRSDDAGHIGSIGPDGVARQYRWLAGR
jgi:hypothetical protein